MISFKYFWFLFYIPIVVLSKKKYERKVKERTIHQEKGFVLKDVKDFGLPLELSTIIEIHKWRRFTSHPQDPVVPLVREFYSNILTGAQSFSMVRGVKVSFSASTINMHYGLEDVVDEYDHLLESVFVEELNSILSTISV